MEEPSSNPEISNSTLCRACLKKTNDANKKSHLFDIFAEKSSSKGGSMQISDLFQKYTSVVVVKHDLLPEYICSSCYKKLKNFHEFYKECNASNAKLLEQRKVIVNKLDDIGNAEGGEQQALFVSIKHEVEFDIDDDRAHSNEISLTEDFKAYDSESDFNFEATFPDESNNALEKEPEPKPNRRWRKRPSKLKYHCDICEKRFSVEHRFLAHKRMHQGLMGYSCQICTVDFSTWESQQEHMKDQHGVDYEPSARFICDVGGCGKTFKLKVWILFNYAFFRKKFI